MRSGVTSILVVDDDADVRSLIEVAFHLTGGWRVVLAESLAAAGRALAESSFDVVLTDNQLGDGDAADVRARAGRTPVVVLSASIVGPASTLVAMEGYAGGITKPFNALTLPALVESALGDQPDGRVP